MTTINKEKNICDVCLRIWGDFLEPNDITNVLNVSPTRTHLKGEKKTSPSGKVRTMKTGYWELDSKSHINSILLNDHIEYLLSVLEFSKKKVYTITGFQGAEISILIGANENSSIEAVLNIDDLNKLVKQKVNIRITVI
jgi:Domain of unknown function (DUF4279)